MRNALMLVLLATSCAVALCMDEPRPAAPQAGPVLSMDAGRVPATKRKVFVARGGDLQRALDNAEPGDLIELENGAVFDGPFHLRHKDGDDWIVVASKSADEHWPAGERVTPSRATGMAKLRASSGIVLSADDGAHHYRFVGIEFLPASGTWLHALVELGGNQRALERLPHHIVIDRCYLHGDPAKGTRRGVALNSSYSAVIDSYFADFKEAGADSQAIAGWNGPGPFLIANNYLEAAGENVMFGGEDPAIANLVPTDIVVTGNHLAKPLRWKKGEPEYEGTAWSVKNLFELKNARRVVVRGNLLEYNWPDAQNGFAILLTVRNQSGGAPWSVVEDVVFENNVVRHVAAGFNILGRDDIHPSKQTQRIAIRGNLFSDIGGEWGQGRLFQLLDGTNDVSITSNTAYQSGAAVFGGDHAPHTGFVFENNLVLHNKFGIGGSGSVVGRPALAKYFPGAIVRGNAFVGGNDEIYPDNNFFPATVDSARTTKAGANVDALMTGMERVTAGSPGPADRTLKQGGIPAPSPEWVFWVSLLLIVYVYAGYPVLLYLRSKLSLRRWRRAPIQPTVSIVVAAHNECERINGRIDNLLALDYPRDKLEILIGCDGCSDDTARRALAYDDDRITVKAFRTWRGKAAVLNDLVGAAAGEIILFADARQRFDAGVVRTLAAHFADPAVGGVSGELMLRVDDNGTSVGRGTSFYWRYEKFIRLHESRVASTVGATGAIYAIRRELFEDIPGDTILDDVLIPLRIVRQGYAIRFEAEARAYDLASSCAHQEFIRKLRTIAGTFQLFARERWLLNPLVNPLWIQTVSHKLLRLALPLLHAALLLSNFALKDGVFYQAALGAQLAFYAAALLGHAFRKAKRRPFLITVPYTLCVMLWATLAGFSRFLTNSQSAAWEQSAPSVESGSTRS